MDTAHPHADVLPGARGRLLAALVQLETPVPVRALARHAQVSPQSALEIVHDLIDAGLVRSLRAGPALMVSLNRDHLAADALVALCTLRSRLVRRLTRELESWPALDGAWLFGSTARAEGDRESDIDVLVVAERDIDSTDWAHATSRLRDQVRSWTGNDLQLVEHTASSFAELVRDRNPLVATLRSEGIPLTEGSRALLRGAA